MIVKNVKSVVRDGQAQVGIRLLYVLFAALEDSRPEVQGQKVAACEKDAKT